MEEDEEEGPRKAEVRMAGVAAKLGLVIPNNLYATCIPSSCTREEYMVGGAIPQHPLPAYQPLSA